MYWQRIWFTARRLAHGRGVFFCLRRNPVRSTPLCSEISIHPPNDRVARGTKCACISLITSSDNSSAALVAEPGSASDKGDRGAANLSGHCTRDRAPFGSLGRIALSCRRPHNDNNAGNGRCPSCHGLTSFAPASSEYRGAGIIHHHWLCRACGHEWITVLHVLV
jgi:hypothetical protein